MSRIIHIPIFNHYAIKLKHGKDIEWSMTCQFKDEDTEEYCDFSEHGSREAVEAAALHHLLTKRGHRVIVFKKVCYHYWLEDKKI